MSTGSSGPPPLCLLTESEAKPPHGARFRRGALGAATGRLGKAVRGIRCSKPLHPGSIPADMHAERCSTPHLARLMPATTVGDAVMADRRQVATRAIVAAGVYLHPNYY